MLKKIAKTLVLPVAIGAITSPAVAENQFYAGGNFAFLEYSEDVVDDDADLTAIYGRLGGHFNKYFSGELRLGFGIGDDDVEFLGVDVDVELENFFGAYIRGGVPVGDVFFPYAVVGYTRGEVKISASGFGSDSESESDVSFGAGADIRVSDTVVINAEYMNYFDKDGAEIDGFSLGAVFSL